MAEILKFEQKNGSIMTPSAGQLITPEAWQKTDEIPTFAEYAEAYLQEKKELWKYSTFCAYQSILQNKLIPFFGKLPLDEITGRLVQQYINQNAKAKSVRDQVQLLKAILNDAARAELVTPKRLDVRYKKNRASDYQVLDDEDYDLLYCCCIFQSYPAAMGILIAMETGARIGEVCCLQWQDFNYSKRAIAITKDIARCYDCQKQKSELIIQPPKTPKSKRIVYLSQQTADHLEKFRPADQKLYICTGKPKPTEPRLLRAYLNRRLDDCGLAHIKFHALRHTFATRAIRAGIDVKTVAELLGHENCNITLDIYTSCNEKAKRDAIDFLYKDKKE